MCEAIFVTSLRPEHLVASWSVKLDNERAAFAETFTLAMDGKVIVSDLLNKKVKIFDKKGQLLSCIGDTNKYWNQLVCPRGIASLPGGRVAVADQQANAIKIFDHSTQLQSRLKGDHLNSPLDLIVGIGQELFVVTDDGRSIVGLRSEGPVITHAVNHAVNLNRPGSIVMTPCGKLVTCDEASSSLHLLNAKTLENEVTVTLSDNAKTLENEVTVTLSDNVDLGGRNRCTPVGVGADVYGYVYVADTNNNRILVFDSRLELVSLIHTQDWFREIKMRRDMDELRLTLSGPVSVTVSDEGELYVLEQAGRVKIFRHFLHKPLLPITPPPTSCCTIL